ncbi:UDP-N-acetylmuramoyl-L-alanine--D-glutamate ligase [Frankia sp. CN6]|uniref:UDP-N-acetylmuramoylalanine--D-glutamate ligase n=2 Tax=Frankia nepalensis TaxID=1836974 RepID=A0A937RE95_9ACTN|nr:UDP-N-acetylmuramoyl-L-alanine--D-glutamate ligase [Frankia nepalensis]MBL7628820.1 UDP-N-acetylmuramoyl-L-alanine--D-glutamate ligase [Frankia nepalensis]
MTAADVPTGVGVTGVDDVKGVPVTVVGVGVSGAAAALALVELGAQVHAVDAGDGEQARAAAAELRAAGARVTLGGLPAEPGAARLVVTSPGVPPGTPLLAAARAAGIPVWGEVELGWRIRPGARWLAVTGTNGKTTTTEMLGAILAADGRRSTTAGNIGTPVVTAALAEPPYDTLAVELSSFQLHYTDTAAPIAAAVLNVAPDHLDWHGGPDGYAADKARIWRHPGTIAVGNADDPVSAALLARAPGRRVTFGLDPATADVTVVDGELVDRAFDGGPLLTVADLLAGGPADPAGGPPAGGRPPGARAPSAGGAAGPGRHLIANALAAAALARADGVAPAAIAEALAAYRPGAHRDAHVVTVDGVRYVDDSKATNPHAALASLTAYPSVVWIAGGLNKGLAFDELVAAARDRLRAVVLIGRCADEIEAALARHAPDVPVERAAGMDDAVEAAARLARAGDTVLLAPAAASMDMFRDYAERGDLFAAAASRRGSDVSPGGQSRGG